MTTEEAAPVEAPAATAPATVDGTAETPLKKFTSRLETIIEKSGHGEMWGVELSPTNHAPTQVILFKFLRANDNNVDAAEKQLTSALEWRKKMQPTELVGKGFNKKKFGDLGYVTVHKDAYNNKETVITWNIYGAVKDNKATFGDVDEFILWRTALMELGVQKLRLNDITEPLPEDATEDPHQMLQVHDYQSVSFFRMDPHVKAASKETIQTMSMAYPELLAHKYFVNVPAIMGWMFGVMKLFLAPATLRKFHPMASGTTLATELPSIVATLPKEYGGQGPSVKEGETVLLTETIESASEPAATDKLVNEATAAGEIKPGEESKPEEAPAEPARDAAVEAKPNVTLEKETVA